MRNIFYTLLMTLLVTQISNAGVVDIPSEQIAVSADAELVASDAINFERSNKDSVTDNRNTGDHSWLPPISDGDSNQHLATTESILKQSRKCTDTVLPVSIDHTVEFTQNLLRPV